MKANEKTPILHILHFRLCLGVNVSLALIISVEEIDLEILIISIVCISCAIMGAVAQIFRNQAAGYNSYIAIFLSYLFVFSVTFYLNYRIYDKVSIAKGLLFSAIALIEVAIIVAIQNHDKIANKFYVLFRKLKSKKEKETKTSKLRDTNNK